MEQKSHYAQYPKAQGMYRPEHEHDACGVGFVASIHGKKSHDILRKALGCVSNLMHRGAVDADAKSGDGAGVLTQIPGSFFKKEVEKLGAHLYNEEDLGIGMFFLPRENAYEQAHCRKIVEEVTKRHGLHGIGWREVPVNPKVLGDKAASTAPRIEQYLVLRPEGEALEGNAYERTLYVCRKEIEKRIAADEINDFYIPSLSSKIVVYKGMLTAPQLERFFTDLHDPEYETAIAVYHQRYSTNTFPTWGLAQPFRMLAHNGEINTIRGNRSWVAAREGELACDTWKEEVENLKPVIQSGSSDSSSLDNALELLFHGGRGLLHTMTMMVPPAFRAASEEDIDRKEKGFYEYHELIAEPWDGPAALAVTDGRYVAACLDRNGLRPARYKITKDGVLLMSSEVGVAETPESEIAEKGRLAPGEAIAIDTTEGKLLRNSEVKSVISKLQPYGDWVRDNLTTLHQLIPDTEANAEFAGQNLNTDDLKALALSFGHTPEETDVILTPMVKNGAEPISSMGDDTPLAVLSERPRHLSHYFRQLFAQVTNPAIDPIREQMVMNTMVFCGAKGNWLGEGEEYAKQLRLDTPVLTNKELEAIKRSDKPHLQSETISTLMGVNEGELAMEARIDAICHQVELAIQEGKTLIVLSDRGSDKDTAAVPMLLAVAGLHFHLIRSGLRMKVSILCDTADCRDVQHFATLIGYGASAINPYLVWDLLAEMNKDGGTLQEDTPSDLIKNYKQAVDKGLLKIMSKLGISKLSSYHAAQIFEIVGLHDSVVDRFFSGTTSAISGLRLNEIAREALRRHTFGYEQAAEPKPQHAGFYRFRRGGEVHAVTPPVLQSLHTFVGMKGEDKANKREDYDKYVNAVEANRPVAVRDLFRFVPGDSVALDEVEPIEDIRRRFTTAGMSFGALSPEAHETLAIAMNRIDGKSNSGEGGEDKSRFTPMENGDSKNSRIKQVASGRFGVTAEYLASATEIEIKVAQGAKPGEGGQIPGHKVSALIAKQRHSTPGVMLISPPPHHDIYSIEDLAQLIYDLKQVNPRAKVCVKLVAEAGVGTIAAGVAKAHADVVLVSGHDGGTGASPISSIKHAGSPWELGVAETQQVLLLNQLRNRITLRTDGGLRSGRDIVMAAILGAEEYNFGTVAMLALGCVYVRQCHLNTCPVGIATQSDKLRAKFKGTAEGVVNYLNTVAEEVREIMASLGVRKLEELIGQTQYLEQISIPDHPKANTLNLSNLLHVPDIDDLTPRYHTWERNDKLEDKPLDQQFLQDAKSSLQTKKAINLKYKVRNTHRCIGTQLSGEIAFRYGDVGLPDGTINLQLEGSAGQSFGCFLVNGVNMTLRGEANDYVGKGMNGGKIVLLTHETATFEPGDNIIAGNTCLYGATGGKLFIHGMAGERFGVRNSGAVSVVEGVGDHCAEYMTRGCLVILGETGLNFGAGMSGGVAYVYDEGNTFEKRYNPGMIEISRPEADEDIAQLKGLINEHLELTNSKAAKAILSDWEAAKGKFWKVSPQPPVDPKSLAGDKEKDEAPAKG